MVAKEEVDPAFENMQVLPEEESSRPYYWTINIGYAWLIGYRPWNYWQNTTECFDRITNLTYVEYDKYKDNKADASERYDRIELTSFLIRNISAHAMHCNDMWISFNYYWKARIDEYEGAKGRFFLSFL